MFGFTPSLRLFTVLRFCAGALFSVTAVHSEVVINEIHYHPDVKTEPVEFIELHNHSSAPVELSGWKLSDGVDYTFPAGAAISANGFLVVSGNPAAVRQKFGAVSLGPWTGKLSNEGERIVLRDRFGSIVDEVGYDVGFPWPTTGDAPGYSIELIDPVLDNDLGGSWRSSVGIDNPLTAVVGPSNRGPTPGVRNSVWSANAPPQIRQVMHSPVEPVSNSPVTITAKITDPNGVAEAALHYQLVEPGRYIELTDASYKTEWLTLPMNDAGADGDLKPDDSVFTVTLPETVQKHRRLVRYRISVKDGTGQSLTVPYSDDPQPNFAYFVYDGVPAWRGAIQPNSSIDTRRTRVTFGTGVMRRLPVYHLLSKAASVQQAQYGGYTGDQYRWAGTLVYDGKVYDHIHYRARGGVWRYAMGKNMWKFDFNRGHSLEARDNFGKKYDIGWDKLNLGACIQQGDYRHRGEQGMFESVGFRLFNLVGVEAPHTHFVQFRVIDNSVEASSTSQYDGDLWGLYLAVEQEDGRFLDQHGLPDGNLYKMEAGTGELNNQGATAATDKSDLKSFQSGYRNTSASDAWWRSRFDVARYYSYQTIVQGIHHYDICYGKNYFYFLNPNTRLWSVHPWDLDLTWANNMYDPGCGGTDEFKNRVLPRAAFNREYKNRIREVRDLLFNTDQLYELIDEYAAMIYDPETANSFVAVDRAMWDYHPIMASGQVNPSKSGQGRFYQVVPTRDFPGMVQKMKDYVVTRSAFLDNLASDDQIPSKPSIAWAGPGGFPVNRLQFRASNYSGANGFAAMEWRLGEIASRDQQAPFVFGEPRAYEIEPLWTSSELTSFVPDITIPSAGVKVGRTYRARVRMKDVTGRWSHWSVPVQFVAGQPDNATALKEHLRISELMYDPAGGTDFEFIELHNSSSSVNLDLAGAAFTQGIDFTFPTGTLLAPGGYLLVVKADPANNFAAFRASYGLDSAAAIAGPFIGSLANGGERIALKTAAGGDDIFDFTYGDGQGWPVAADGAGHSLVPSALISAGQGAGALNYPRYWRASAFIGGSPGMQDPAIPAGVVINEFAAATTSPVPGQGNDWIELFNPAGASIDLTEWYLSDDSSNLKRWPIPRTTLAANSWIAFDEAAGLAFGLSQSGEQIFLSHLPGGNRDRVADGIRFKAQDPEISLGRFPDGGEFFVPMRPSRAAENNAPSSPAIVISEVMYHPPELATGGGSGALEYIELFNPGVSPVQLFNAQGAWRLDGGVNFVFPTNTIIGPGAHLLVVNFSLTNTTALGAFRSVYGFDNSQGALVGPYGGSLNNCSDRVALEKPNAPEVATDPPVWAIIDEVIYSDRAPWPSSADGSGDALHRRAATPIGNDPGNWLAASASPGRTQSGGTDSDNDGLPDEWERANGLDPNSAADAVADPDNDGMSNLEEFLSGTDPRDGTSVLAVTAAITSIDELTLRFTAVAGRRYVVEFSESLGTGGGGWTQLAEVPAQPQARVVQVVDSIPSGNRSRFYRIAAF